MVALTASRDLVAATHRGDFGLVVIDDAGHRLRADAAASVERMRAAGCPTGNVNSAYRTAEEQKREVKRASAGATPSAAATGTSWHEAALAVDWPRGPMREWARAHGAAHGWVFTLASEPWHAVYVPDLDRHTDRPTDTEDDDMIPAIQALYRLYLNRPAGDADALDLAEQAQANGWTIAQLRAAFVTNVAEAGTVIAAFRRFLGHDPSAAQIDEWADGERTIAQVWAGVSGSPEALARRARP